MNRILDNPVLLKEFRGRMRGGKAFILLTIYLVLMSGVVGVVLLTFAAASDSPGSSDITELVGKILFWTVAAIEMMMICFIAPALTAGAISSERERQTYDLLRTTLLSAPELVFGKFASALSFLLLMLFVAFPLQSLAYLLGGVAVEEVFISFLLLVVTTLVFSAAGLFVSSFTRQTLVSTVISYIVANGIIFGIPAIVYSTLSFVAGIGLSNPNFTTFQETLLTVIVLIVGWAFVAVNPIATAIATEVILISEQSAFYASIPLPNGWSFPIISPWIGYVLFYTLISLVLILLSIRLVRRVER
ncbi:MAG: ABC transporter permease [Anaerolineales bacterium]|nr:ABC transporter permease [Anaerolineales bacterium]